MGRQGWEWLEGKGTEGEEVLEGQPGPRAPEMARQRREQSPGSGCLAFHPAGTRPLAPAA